MRILYRHLLFVLCVISHTLCEEDIANNAKVENLKFLRKAVDFAYKAGNNFLGLIRGPTPLTKTFQLMDNVMYDNPDFNLTYLITMNLPFVGFIVLILIGMIFIIFLPIVGFCFCLCRCCGKCGGRVTGMDPKHATCKRYTFTLFLAMIIIGQLGGIVLAFINNQLIHESLTNPSLEINALKQMSFGHSLLNESLRNVTEAINASERSSDANVEFELKQTNLQDVTCAKYFSVLKNETEKRNISDDLSRIGSKLNDTANYIDGVKGDPGKLRTYSSEFGAKIHNLKIFDIRSQVCSMLKKIVNDDFDALKNLIRSQIKEESRTGSKMKDIVNGLNETFLTPLESFIKNVNGFMKVEYLEYRMYVCIAVCCLLLLIILFYFLGLCFGQCGERPFEDARICNRGVGANLMMAGVAFAFLFTPMIAIFEMSFFTNAAVFQTDFCRYATNSFDPGVKALDSMIRQFRMIKLKDVSPNTFDSIINRCPSESMVAAFNLQNTMMSDDVSNKTTAIGTNVRTVAILTKMKIVDDYLKVVEDLLLKISSEVTNNRGKYEGFDTKTKTNILDNLTSISNEITKSPLTRFKEIFMDSFDVAAIGFQSSLTYEVMSLFNRINREKYKDVRCDGIYRSSTTIIDSICVTFLWPFNGFLFGIGICLLFTIPAIIFAVKLAGLYRRTEKYSSDYEEPDYNSYMGFYTNNADNIPMKRPKSAKSNNKNRNSNSNTNKESLKQNNPQYLPVYPYDGYE